MTETESFAFQRLDVYVAARELAALVHHSRVADAELRDQVSRASKSVVLNLAEGLGSESQGVRRRHFSLAAGSVHEVAARWIWRSPSARSRHPRASGRRPSPSA